jgi:diketogulonate reductase-like aldo/keto reductase
MTSATSSTQLPCPPILYGTAWKKLDTERLVSLALQQGFRGIDTACQPKHYHEAGVGAGIAASLDGSLTRAGLYLQTKFTPLSGQDPTNVPYDPTAPLPEQVRQSFAVSLRNLRTDYLDCLVLHSPLSSAQQTLDVWQAMESLVSEGGVRQLGISNCYALELLQSLYRSARIKPRVVQNRFYSDTGYDRDIRAFCGSHGIAYQTFWTLSANPHILSHPALRALASTYARTVEQVFFRYLTQNGLVPLTGTRSQAHMREDLAIFQFELTDQACRQVDQILR